MTVYQFMGENPWLTFFLALIVAEVVKLPFMLVNRLIRHRNIAAAGWPPFHLDGDGNTRTLDSDDIEAIKASSVTRHKCGGTTP